MDSKNEKIFMIGAIYVKAHNENYLLLSCDDGNSLKVSKIGDDTLKIKQTDSLDFSKLSLLSDVNIISVENISLVELKDPDNFEEIINRLLHTGEVKLSKEDMKKFWDLESYHKLIKNKRRTQDVKTRE